MASGQILALLLGSFSTYSLAVGAFADVAFKEALVGIAGVVGLA